MGEGTAAAWTAHGLTVAFVGRGSPVEVAGQFVGVAAGQRVGFLQAAQSKTSIAQLLGPEIAATEVVTYESIERGDVRTPGVEVALLTSPRSASAFLEVYARAHGGETAAAMDIYSIGPTTAAAVAALGYRNAGVAPQPSVAALVGCLA